MVQSILYLEVDEDLLNNKGQGGRFGTRSTTSDYVKQRDSWRVDGLGARHASYPTSRPIYW